VPFLHKAIVTTYSQVVHQPSGHQEALVWSKSVVSTSAILRRTYKAGRVLIRTDVPKVDQV